MKMIVSEDLSQILVMTLIAVATPQIVHAAQPEATGASAGASLDAGVDTTAEPGAPVVTSEAESSGNGKSGNSDNNGGAGSSGDTSGPVVVATGYDGVKGKLRLHFDVDFLVQPQIFDFDEGLATFLRPTYGLGFGYGVHKNIVVGARLAFNFTRVRNRDEELLDNDVLEVSRGSIGSFTPYVEFLPIATGRILPFFGLRAGFGWQTQTDRQKGEVLGVPVDAGVRSSELGPLVGLSGGAHFFLTPGFSFDAAALFDTRWYFGRSRELGEGAADPPDWAASTAVMNFGLGLGMSAWF